MENKIIWPGWETVGLIGRGSFGAVYKIQRNVLGNVEEAALKVISIPQNAGDIDSLYDDGYDDESIRSTFQSHLKSIIAEYTLMRKLNGCANIVNCDDVRYVPHDDEIGWDIFIKMELLKPLARSLPGQIAEETVMKIAEDMCKALIVCKENGVVHRDIKPQNIFLSPHGDYKLGDFGIAKTVEQTMGGTKIGTYNYMAPEVYNNQPYGTTADIYSLGLVLYWLLNERRLPFLPLPPEKLDADMERRSRERRFSGEPLPPPSHGSEKLKAIVLKACAFDPKKRYASAQEMLVALQSKVAPQPDPKPTPKNLDVHKEVSFKYKDRPAGKYFSIRVDYKDVRYYVPIDVKDGQIIHLPKEGKHDRNTGCKGDLYITIHILPPKWDWRSVLKVVLAITVVCLVVWSCSKVFGGKVQVEVPEETAHVHSWKAATCTDPKTCKLCGITSGSSLGHSFKDASCTEPKTCTVCGKTDGVKLDHQWEEPTIYAPKTCKVCGTMEGEPVDEIETFNMTSEGFMSTYIEELYVEALLCNYGWSVPDVFGYLVDSVNGTKLVNITCVYDKETQYITSVNLYFDRFELTRQEQERRIRIILKAIEICDTSISQDAIFDKFPVEEVLNMDEDDFKTTTIGNIYCHLSTDNNRFNLYIMPSSD